MGSCQTEAERRGKATADGDTHEVPLGKYELRKVTLQPGEFFLGDARLIHVSLHIVFFMPLNSNFIFAVWR
jgi:hypothetical protein